MKENQNQTHADSPVRKKRTRLYELPADKPHETAAEIPRETVAVSRPAAVPLFQDTAVPQNTHDTPAVPNVEPTPKPNPDQAPPQTHIRTDAAGEISLPNTVPAETLDTVLTQHVYASIAIGLVPVPLVDYMLITGIQINLLRVLTKLYGVSFTDGPVKKFIASMLASVTPVAAAPALAASIAKIIPVAGHGVGVVTMPILGGAATYALGKVFIQHFASGGTLLSFDPEKMRAHYQQMFQEGRQVAATMKKNANDKK